MGGIGGGGVFALLVSLLGGPGGGGVRRLKRDVVYTHTHTHTHT